MWAGILVLHYHGTLGFHCHNTHRMVAIGYLNIYKLHGHKDHINFVCILYLLTQRLTLSRCSVNIYEINEWMNIVQHLCVQHFVTLHQGGSPKPETGVQPLLSRCLLFWSWSALDTLLIGSTNNGRGVGVEGRRWVSLKNRYHEQRHRGRKRWKNIGEGLRWFWSHISPRLFPSSMPVPGYGSFQVN